MGNNGNIFERNPKKTLAVVIFVLLISLTQGIEYFLASQTDKLQKGSGVKRNIRLREHQPDQDIYMKPDNAYMKKTDSLEQKQYRFRTDNNGFIRPTNIHADPDFRIVFLGGSTTECLYVDEELRFPYYTGIILEKKSGLRVNSYNSGVSGNNSMHSNDILLNKVIPLHPDYVILYHNINDITILLIQGGYWNDHFNRSLIYKTLLQKDSTKDFSIHSKLKAVKDLICPNLYGAIKSSFGDKKLADRDEWEEFRGKKITINKKFILSEFRKSLNTFINICRVHEIVPILMTQASRLKKEPDQKIKEVIFHLKRDFGIEYDQFREIHCDMNETIRRVALDNKVMLVDLEKEIPKEKSHMYDVGHYNNEGSKAVAEIVAGKLKSVNGSVGLTTSERYSANNVFR